MFNNDAKHVYEGHVFVVGPYTYRHTPGGELFQRSADPHSQPHVPHWTKIHDDQFYLLPYEVNAHLKAQASGF